MNMKKPYVVGISGGTCSGKSTLLNLLNEIFVKRYKTSVINMDDYYNWSQMKTIAPITRIEYPEHNHPSAVDTEKLYKDISNMVFNEDIDIVLIEGIFALYFDELRKMLNLKIFVDLKSDERMCRRIKRMIDYESFDDITSRYLDTVRYRHDEFIEPTRWYADIILNGTFDANKGIPVIVSCIEASVKCLDICLPTGCGLQDFSCLY